MPQRAHVPPEMLRKWQETVDVLAEIMHVPSATIMQVEPPDIKVFVSSASKGNPYEAGSLNTDGYCKIAMATRQPLLVPDARRDERWKSGPGIQRGIISYLGVPITWPDGEMFGTICVCDNKSNEYSELYLRLLRQWRDMLQTDLSTLTILHRQLEERDAKIRRLVEANIIGIFLWNLDGRVIEANDAFLHMVGHNREDLVSDRIRWTDLTPPEWLDRDVRQWLPELNRTGSLQPFEKEFFRKDGSRVPVLIGLAIVEESGNEGVAFVLDLTERKLAAEALRETQMELAHANRVATMGQLTASIAHEVNQPITASITDAQAALRWLGTHPPNLGEVRSALHRIIASGGRAGDVIGHIRSLVKKTPPRKDSFNINNAVLEVIALTRSEALRHGVSVQTDLATDLPLIAGDRVELQQVILNLIVNAIEAMSRLDQEARGLRISTTIEAPNSVLVAVRDTGPGLDPKSTDRLFEAFYTTKPEGMGMGLAICRSIIETHGGRLWATANEPRGAVLQFTLPPQCDET